MSYVDLWERIAEVRAEDNREILLLSSTDAVVRGSSAVNKW